MNILRLTLKICSLICTSWSSVNQILNFKFSAFFRVLFALWSLKYPHPKSQQTPRVSTELEMVVNLSYSFIPLQKILQKGVDRPVENPQKSAENIKMKPNALNKFYWCMRRRNAPPLYLFRALTGNPISSCEIQTRLKFEITSGKSFKRINLLSRDLSLNLRFYSCSEQRNVRSNSFYSENGIYWKYYWKIV